jgi:hypothetical protein
VAVAKTKKNLRMGSSGTEHARESVMEEFRATAEATADEGCSDAEKGRDFIERELLNHTQDNNFTNLVVERIESGAECIGLFAVPSDAAGGR